MCQREVSSNLEEEHLCNQQLQHEMEQQVSYKRRRLTMLTCTIIFDLLLVFLLYFINLFVLQSTPRYHFLRKNFRNPRGSRFFAFLFPSLKNACIPRAAVNLACSRELEIVRSSHADGTSNCMSYILKLLLFILFILFLNFLFFFFFFF